MIFSFLYELALWLLALVTLPKVLYDYYVKKKYKQSLGSRLGFNFPIIKKGGRKLVWIHAVSVGETKAITALVKTIRNEMHNPIIVISNITETGHAESKRVLPLVDYHVFLPIDLRFIIRPIVKLTAPDLVIVSETDLWYNFLKSARDFGAKLVLVNAKISERSFNRYQKFTVFSHKIFSLFDLICVQSKHYYERFKNLGISTEKLKITGNLKFDDEYPKLTQEQHDVWKQQFQITEENQIVVVGSSHDPEEKMILDQMKLVWLKFPHAKLMIVPRHPERFHDVAGVLEKEAIPYMRFSQINGGCKNAKVILVDAMGLLRKCYQLADIAIVAGSYISRVGGHNILEPCWYGVPVIYGPYMQTQPELVELIQEHGAGLQVSINQLANVLIDLLENKPRCEKLGSSGLNMMKEINGATKKTWDFTSQILNDEKHSTDISKKESNVEKIANNT
jgi:3-deoxy-D-manno-octulosonic-acid transferase